MSVIYIFAVSKEYATPVFPKEMETTNNNDIYRTRVLKQADLPDITECRKLFFNSIYKFVGCLHV